MEESSRLTWQDDRKHLAPGRLQRIYNLHVAGNEKRREQNKRIAYIFMRQFGLFCTEHNFLTMRTITVIPHGSVFERLRVGEADQLDFMVVLDRYGVSERLTPIPSSQLGSEPLRETQGYFAMKFDLPDGPESPQTVYSDTVEGKKTGNTYLSALKYEMQLQTAVKKFLKKQDVYKDNEIGTVLFKASLTETCTKIILDFGKGDTAEIYLSVAMEMMFEGKSQQYFFAKPNRGKAAAHLWLLSSIGPESHLIMDIPDDILPLMRFCKYLFQSFLPKQVLRTSLLYLYRSQAYGSGRFDNSAWADKILGDDFLFICALIGFVRAALDSGETLTVFGNRYEDTLAKMDEAERARAKKILDNLHDMVAREDARGVVDYLDRLAAYRQLHSQLPDS